MPMGERTRAYTGTHVVCDFQLNTEGIAKIAMNSFLKDAVTSIARDRAMPYAIRISPRSTEAELARRRKRGQDEGHRHYQDSFTVKTGSTVINQMRRVAARLWNLSGHAVVVEFGNKRTNGEGYRVLGRTLNYLNGPVVGELTSVRLDRQRKARLAAKKAAKGDA